MSAPYYLRSVAGGHHKPGAVNALPDLLDAAVLPELLAAAWDEGHHAGHEEARHEHAFGHPAPAPTEPGPKGNPRLSARFVEWMMMLPAGWVTDTPGISRKEAIHALGNGVVSAQAAQALAICLSRAGVWPTTKRHPHHPRGLTPHDRTSASLRHQDWAHVG